MNRPDRRARQPSFRTLVLCVGVAWAPAGCGSSHSGGAPPARGGASTGGSGAGQPSGGANGSGGTIGTGGTSTGGTLSTGGTKAAGGMPGTGSGSIGSGGVATGGVGSGGVGTGGMGTGGAAALGGNGDKPPCSGSNACVDFAMTQQEIDGFGASIAWSGVVNQAVMQAGFGNATNAQMGLSILRVDIDPGGQSHWSSQKTNVMNAKALGAKYVFATPWSPPASMKSNNSTVNGSLDAGSYADFAAYLSSFYQYMAGAVDIISVQNEPNITGTNYLSCNWTAAELYDFAKNDAQAIGAPVMMPETFNYDTSYSDPILMDPVAAGHVQYIGLHLYGAKMKTYSLAVQMKKKIWMTEHYFNPEDAKTLMAMGKEIMDCLDNQMNAYVWWYLLTPSCNLVTSSGVLLNKGYVMAQFSKYIRPGAYRVAATYQPQPNVNVQAFSGTNAVIVALNQGTAAAAQTFTVANGTAISWHRYTTSSTKKLNDDGVVAMSNGSFTVMLDPQSISTFVAAGAAP